MPQRYALLVGNGIYTAAAELDDLPGPINDIQLLSELFGAPEIGGYRVSTFVDAGHREVLRALEVILATASKEDFVLIHYSGHGVLDRRRNLYLATTDTEAATLLSSSIPVSTLKMMVDNSRCQNVFLVFDCCYSGAAGEAWTRGGAETVFQSLGSGIGLHVLTSSTSLQTSMEAVDDQGRRLGAMSQAIVDGIKSGLADLNGDGLIDVQELAEFVQASIAKQTPRFWSQGASGKSIVAQAPAAGQERRRIAAEVLKNWSDSHLITKAEYRYFRALVTEGRHVRRRQRLLVELTSPNASPSRVVGSYRLRGHVIQAFAAAFSIVVAGAAYRLVRPPLPDALVAEREIFVRTKEGWQWTEQSGRTARLETVVGVNGQKLLLEPERRLLFKLPATGGYYDRAEVPFDNFKRTTRLFPIRGKSRARDIEAQLSRAPEGREFVVYFPFEQDILTPEAESVLIEASKHARGHDVEVVLTGPLIEGNTAENRLIADRIEVIRKWLLANYPSITPRVELIPQKMDSRLGAMGAVYRHVAISLIPKPLDLQIYEN